MRWGIAVAAVLVLAGCTHGGPTRRTVDPAGPGDELGDGFTVPEGTYQLGDIRHGAGQGWDAQLFVEDAEAAMSDVLDQIEAHGGLELRNGCYDQESNGYGKYCSLGAVRIEDGFVLERVSVDLRVSLPDAWGYASNMTISYGSWPPATQAVHREVQPPFEGIGPFPDPIPPPAIPQVNDPMPSSYDEVFHVVPGTRVIAPVRTLDVCNGGFYAHVQVTGDLGQVVVETRHRFEQMGGIDDTTVEHGEADGHDTVQVVGGNDASARFAVRVGNDGEPTWGTVEYCTD